MKRNFFAGLIIILPLVITGWLLTFLMRLLAYPCRQIGRTVLHAFAWIDNGFWMFSADQILDGLSSVIGIVSVFILLCCIGIVSRFLYLHVLVKGVERLIAKIPLVSTIYKTCREVTDLLCTQKQTPFSRVLLVPFPSQSSKGLGFVTNRIWVKTIDGSEKFYSLVFIPGTPNPSNSFLLLCQEGSLVPTDLTADEAVQWVVSCGSSIPKHFLKETSRLVDIRGFPF